MNDTLLCAGDMQGITVCWFALDKQWHQVPVLLVSKHLIHKAAMALASAFQEAAGYSSLCLTGVITEPSAGFLGHLLKHSGVGPRTP